MPDTARPHSLKRDLGPLEATALVIGHIIGAGIFLLPASVADTVGSPALALATWLIAGLLAGAAALCFAELSAAIPQTGGTYAFLKRAYRSELLGFAFAWMMCFAYGSGAIAVVGIFAGNYLAPFAVRAGLVEQEPAQAIAVGLIGALALVNYLGVRLGGLAQDVLTSIKVLLCIAVVALPVAFVDVAAGRLLEPLLPAGRPAAETLGAVGTAMIFCLFAYNGAYSVTHVAGEIRNPERNVPRAILVGFGIVLLLYLAINAAYLLVLPFEELRTSPRIAGDVMQAAFGPLGADLTAVAIALSAIGVLNAQLLNYPRITFALASDGLFFRRMAHVDARTQTPSAAILLVGGWACVLALSGTYDEILKYIAFVLHAFIALTVAAVIVLRGREPGLARPYRVWGYPWTPLAFLLVSAGYLLNLVVNEWRSTLVGIAIVAAGLPFFYYWRRRKAR